MNDSRFGKVDFDKVQKLESNIHQLFRKERRKEKLTTDNMIANSNGNLTRSYIEHYMCDNPKSKDLKLSNLIFLADSLGFDINVQFVRRKK